MRFRHQATPIKFGSTCALRLFSSDAQMDCTYSAGSCSAATTLHAGAHGHNRGEKTVNIGRGIEGKRGGPVVGAPRVYRQAMPGLRENRPDGVRKSRHGSHTPGLLLGRSRPETQNTREHVSRRGRPLPQPSARAGEWRGGNVPR